MDWDAPPESFDRAPSFGGNFRALLFFGTWEATSLLSITIVLSNGIVFSFSPLLFFSIAVGFFFDILGIDVGKGGESFIGAPSTG